MWAVAVLRYLRVLHPGALYHRKLLEERLDVLLSFCSAWGCHRQTSPPSAISRLMLLHRTLLHRLESESAIGDTRGPKGGLSVGLVQGRWL